MKNLKTIVYLIILPLSLMLFRGFASAEPARKDPASAGLTVITGIQVMDNAVEIRGDRPFVYTVYSSDPYKVVVEIPDADLGTFRSPIKSARQGVTEVTPSQVTSPKQMAKVEVLLQSPNNNNVDPKYQNNSLLLQVREDKPEPVKMARAQEPLKLTAVEKKNEPAAAEEKGAGQKATEIIDISFEQIDGIVKVIIRGNGSLTPSVFTLKDQIVVDIPDAKMKTSVPSSVVSPVKSIRSGAHRDKTRLVIQLQETRDFDALTLKDTLVIAIKSPEARGAKMQAQPAVRQELPEPPVVGMKETELPPMAVAEGEMIVEGKFTGKRISLDFQEADVVPIFRLLSDVSGFNMVVSPDVKGKLTMKLINVPWDQALELILRTFRLGKSVEGNIIRIAPLTVFTKEDEEKAKMKEAALKAEPLETKIFPVSYADVAVIEKGIKDSKILTPRGSISVDKRTSSLVVKDAPSVFPQVEVLLKTLDKPTPQVMVEGRIVEVNTGNTREFGIQWGININAANALGFLGGLSTLGVGPFTGGNYIVDFPSAAGAGSGSGISFGLLSPDRTLGLDLQLSALETIGKGKIISNPKIMTIDNGRARIAQGKSIPVRKLTSEGTVSSEYKDVVIELIVTPHIAPDRSITMNIDIKKEELDPTVPPVDGVPGTDKKEATTNVIVKDGETVVIGGMYKINDQETESGLPYLMNLPVLKWLFKKDKLDVQTSELLIFITPRIVESQKN